MAMTNDSDNKKALKVDPQLKEALLKASVNGKITCPKAREIAEAFNIEPKAVGRACNFLKLKISYCALGIFEVEPEIKEAVTKAAKDGVLTCSQAHAIAQELDVSPYLIGIACNKLNIKVRGCLLGCFR